MKCIDCLIDKKIEDFILGSRSCYKCAYCKKLVFFKKEPVALKHCRECEGELPNNRWTYCSEKCAIKGKLKQRRNYWTNKVKNL